MAPNRKIVILLLSSLLVNNVNGQSDCLSILVKKIEETCEDNEQWKFTSSDNNITLIIKGNFSTNTLLGPRAISRKELNHPGTNSLSFHFRISEGWSDSTFTRVKNRNRILLEQLQSIYTNYYDSTGWPPRHSKSMFELNPMMYLKDFKHTSEFLVAEIIRLPDFRIDECGVWIDPSIDFSIFYIVQPKTRELIYRVILNIVALDSHVKTSLDGIRNY